MVGRENLYGAIALLAPIAWPEPFGLVLIEAMACGTPVIAFNRGSVPEIVEDGLTGFIVERKEEAVAATDQLSRLSRGAIRWRFEERFTARRIVCPWRTLPCPVMGRPPEFLQPLAQGRNACLSDRIVRSQHYYGEVPHTLRLLRTSRKRSGPLSPRKRTSDLLSVRPRSLSSFRQSRDAIRRASSKVDCLASTASLSVERA